MTKPVRGTIPRWGRTFARTITRFSELELVTNDWANSIVEAVQNGKGLATEDEEAQQRRLQEYLQQGLKGINLEYDRNRLQHRLAFMSRKINLGGIECIITGTEPHNGISAIRLSDGEFALTGFDEILSMLYNLFEPNVATVKTWKRFNRVIRPDQTDVRIVGSAGLGDGIGFFAISSEDHVTDYIKDIEGIVEASNRGVPIYVKGRYEGLAHYLLDPNSQNANLKIIPVTNIEQALMAGGIAIDIVDSGKTAHQYGLVVIGPPLLLSETVIAVDQGKYSKDENLRQAIAALQPQQQPDKSLYGRLSANLGDRWINKPENAFAPGQYATAHTLISQTQH